MSTRILTSAEAAREALDQLLMSSKDYFVIGEGVPDPKACFGTTKGLKEKYPHQVFDMPVSENGMTGVCVGAALGGLRPIMIHMRQDFLLYAMDQIVNNAAKWHSQFGSNGGNVPMVIKAFTGRGWGAGHQHAQNLSSLFAHIPGLKVVAPSTARHAKGLFISSAKDQNPVLILEHRWIHNITGHVPEEIYETPIGKAEVVKEGSDVTMVAWSYQLHEARRACEILEEAGVSVELIDLLSLRPIDYDTVMTSVMKTKRVVVVDESWSTGSLAGEIIATLAEVVKPKEVLRLTNPDFYPSSTPALTKGYYPTARSIAVAVSQMFSKKVNVPVIKQPHDIPDPSYKGPF
jgi:pyruvate dehydrogenase E1 component beta subunit